MLEFKKTYVFWFVTGSQHLYGPEPLQEVQAHSEQIVNGLNERLDVSFDVVVKPVLTTAEEVHRLCMEANADETCAGIITWMHTFSPAKMWIAGLDELKKPLLHLHTQFNRDIPWDRIDMDFMNLNQSAHGDREFGFIGARMGIKRKVIAGYWQDENVLRRTGEWMRTAVAHQESRQLKVARFGDNMRRVAVTEGDKVEAAMRFGWQVNGHGVGDLVESIGDVSEQDLRTLMDEYDEIYDISPEGRSEGAVRDAIREQARIELGLKAFLQAGGYSGFTTTFEDLHGMQQLPGLAVQRLMAEGYGFGAEGDWKTAALVRVMKMIADGKETSFMEDYTYHLDPNEELVLGSHMLEVCPSVAATRPSLEVHPLDIGGKGDPARLVFDGIDGPAVNASVVDMGNRFRLLVNEVDAVRPKRSMPHLPVARVLWQPQPSLSSSAEAWIYAGGAHHTCFSTAVTSEHLSDWAEMVGMECLFIDKDTSLGRFRNELKWNELVWKS